MEGRENSRSFTRTSKTASSVGWSATPRTVRPQSSPPRRGDIWDIRVPGRRTLPLPQPGALGSKEGGRGRRKTPPASRGGRASHGGNVRTIAAEPEEDEQHTDELSVIQRHRN